MCISLSISHTLPLFAQFSPGDLSRAHQGLDGIQQCTKCHEVGNTIDGTKCLTCHDEIKSLLEAEKGYHYRTAKTQCVECHKEHLGRNAATFQFDEKTFDHSMTGFTLTGKHRFTACAACHSPSNIRDSRISRKLAEYPHTTFLGISQTCNSCHQDPHRQKFGLECASCHSAASWKQVQSFDHAKTTFALTGKHTAVSCEKCHPGMKKSDSQGRADFATQNSADCSPCHSSPHVSSFGNARCGSCHSPEGWHLALKKPFDHRQTRYQLIGKHRTVQCEQCHRVERQANFAATFLLSFRECTDCHRDRHNGEFAANYKNDCATCHTVEGYSPSTFSPKEHATSRFALTGAHAATLCSACHLSEKTKEMVFHFSSVRCDACHRDVHNGQFSSQMKSLSCGQCHTTGQWKTSTFDHSATAFPLAGKHAGVTCRECHKETNSGINGRQFQKVSARCESCHPDIHQRQFETDGATQCDRCHRPDGWRELTFSHESQSKFSLTGAHKKVRCDACHKLERTATASFVRFKPVATACVSCHQQGGVQ